MDTKGRFKVKTGLLKRLLLFMVATLIVNALLVAAVFTYISRNVFANMKAEELVPKATFIARVVSQFRRGEISSYALETTLISDTTLWDATLHVFNASGDVIARSVTPESDMIQEKLMQYLPDIVDEGAWRLVMATTELGIVVGVPVYGVDASVTGAVFLTKPLKEVNTALGGLNAALIISSIIVMLVVLIPAYLGSRGFTMPLRQMSQVARAMAAGDFSIRADDARDDETGELGHSLNELSQALSHTIGDLMLERNRLVNVLDGLSEGVMAIDAEGHVTHCNSAALRLLNSDNPEQANSRLADLMPCFSKGSADVRTVTFEDKEFRIAVSELTGYEGGHFGAVATIQDVTEEARLERTRRDYVANVSHELRTPIASIRGLSEALNDGMVKKEADKTRYYGYILHESMRLSRLIDDLLELSRLQTGGVALIKSRFDMRNLLTELAERFEEDASRKGLGFSSSFPEGKLMVVSNTDRIEQVLICLLDNAVKYAQKDKDIKLTAKQEGDELIVSVLSAGRIGEEHLPHLFERFYKADTSHSGQGTGLGLSIAWEVMELLNGRIWAENLEEYACFSIAVPLYFPGKN